MVSCMRVEARWDRLQSGVDGRPRGVLLDLGQVKPFLDPLGGTSTLSIHEKDRTHSANEGPDSGSVADGLETYFTFILSPFVHLFNTKLSNSE